MMSKDGPATGPLRCALDKDPSRAPLQTKQGNRPTGHDQEGRRGLNEVVLGNSVFPLSETGVLGDFWGRIKGAKYRFAFQDGTWDIF